MGPIIKKHAYVYFAFVFLLMVYILSAEDYSFLLPVLSLYSGLLIYYEYLQIKSVGFYDYFSNIWNYMDLTGYTCLFIYTLLSLFGVSLDKWGIYLFAPATFVIYVRSISQLRAFT